MASEKTALPSSLLHITLMTIGEAMRTLFILVSILVFPLLCWSVTDPKPNTWEKELKDIAKDYNSYGRVDQLVRFGIEDCRLPAAPTVRMSRSKDEETHGQKLYTVFAKHKAWDVVFARQQTYLPPWIKGREGKERGVASVGQVIVKEAWVPVEVSLEEVRADPRSNPFQQSKKQLPPDPKKGEHLGTIDYSDAMSPYAFNPKSKKHYKASAKAGLFIMFKVDPATPDTDQGWVYGSVSADGQKVTAAGKIASCMNCHQQAPHDRLFGLKE
jgi:hypothetical protein